MTCKHVEAGSSKAQGNPPLIATVDDYVAWLHMLHEDLDGGIHWRTRLDQDDNTPANLQNKIRSQLQNLVLNRCMQESCECSQIAGSIDIPELSRLHRNQSARLQQGCYTKRLLTQSKAHITGISRNICKLDLGFSRDRTKSLTFSYPFRLSSNPARRTRVRGLDASRQALTFGVVYLSQLMKWALYHHRGWL